MFHRGAGCEVSATDELGPDMHGAGSGSVTRDTSFPVSGLAAWKFDSTGGNAAAYNELDTSFGLSGSTSYYARVWLRFEALPASSVVVFQHGSPTTIANGAGIKLTSGGKLQLWDLLGGTQIGSDSAMTVSTGVYYCLEIGSTMTVSTEINAVEARVDEATIASASGLSITGVGQAYPFGWREAPGASKVCYADDFVLYDSTGSSNNTWVGTGPKVIWMSPESDGQVGSWTGGAGGVSNLFEAINNIPPAGLASASATNTSQIETSDSSGDNSTDEYRANCGSYIAAGLVATDTVNGIAAWINTGEDINTNTKTGSYFFQSNPSSSVSTFTFGDDLGAVGTWNSGWTWTGGASTVTLDSPSVVLANDAILAIRKTDAGTRVAAIDAIGFYVTYTPAEPSPLMWYTTL